MQSDTNEIDKRTATPATIQTLVNVLPTVRTTILEILAGEQGLVETARRAHRTDEYRPIDVARRVLEFEHEWVGERSGGNYLEAEGYR